MAIIDDFNLLLTRLGNANADLSGLGIQRVFDELFDNGGRALNDLASGNLGGDFFWEQTNGHGTKRKGSCRQRQGRKIKQIKDVLRGMFFHAILTVRL